MNQATITVADLADGYLALTLGTTITLDIDAAGYGWFIDPTPFTHEEFVSLSAWELAAASGSGAENKIDLMTVLMHELGHVMGLGHTSSAVDGTRLMAGAITPGIRRVPSALDLGLSGGGGLSGLSGATDLDHSPLDVWEPYRIHVTTTQNWLPAVNPASLVQAAHTPSHVGIFNSGFGITDPANTQYGWDRSGAVTIANGQAVLSEDSNVISTLSQTFTLPAGSTHLRFTLVDVNLVRTGTGTGSAGASPQDTFEVALLEASTMTPLAGVTAGLTQTDSLFNLQQDGTVRFSNRVTLSNGLLSGSTLDLTQPVIVDIDLTGITVGAGAYLSFDLLGFGDRTSTIVLDHVLLTDGQPTAVPVAVNDSYTVAEGATFNVPTLGLLTNDTDTDTSQVDLATALVSGPAHGTLTLRADGSFSYVHNGSETLTDSFTYRVSDGINLSNIATVSFTITPTNDAPTIAVIPAQSVEQGRTLSVTVVATDLDDSNSAAESNTLTYSLGAGAPAGASIDPTTGVLTWSVPRTQTVGVYQITVNVTDAGTPALSATRTVTVEVEELTNTPPTLDPIGPKTVNEETELRFTISATDLDIPAQILIYSATGLPAGATFDAATGEFVWTPTEAQGGSSYQVTFSVTDGEFSASEIVTITVNEVNVAPVLDPIGAKIVNEETELRFTISGSDVDDPAQTLVYSASGLPTGATFDASTREFVWTPTETQGPATYQVTFSVTDGVVTTSEIVTITVNEVNQAPVLDPIGNKTVNEGALLSFTAVATDVDFPNQVLTYSLAAGAPVGASIHASTGLFTWTPIEGPGASPLSVTVHVSDGVVTTSETIAITVVNVAPTVSVTPATNVQEGVSATYTVQFQDPGRLDTHQIQINWGDGSAVETVTSTADASAGLSIPRSHTYGDGGSYTITVTVTDDEGASRSATATVTVNNLAPTVTVTPATQTKQYSDPITPIVITATDVTADTLNVTTAWSTNGTTFTAGLPDELTITGGLVLTGAANQVGTASWTISGIADLDPAKTYTIRVTVTDEDGGSTVQQSILDIDQEQARVTYDGVLYASTPSISTSTTTIQLRATIQDITAVLPGSDATPGLITTATVTFVNRETGAIIASNVPISLVNPADPKTGTAVYNWTVTLPNNSNSESYTIGTIVNGYYTRNSSTDNTVVTVSLPQNDFLTGGGYLINQQSAGAYAGDAGEKTNFGFNVKFNKQLTNLQGKANIIIRKDGQIYQVKTNATNSLSTTQVSPGVFDATFTSKANLTNITDPLNPISLGGNLDLIVTLRDAGEPGTADTIGITLWQGNTLLFSSHWTGTQTVQQLLGGGNLQVRQSSPLLAAKGAAVEVQGAAALTAAQLAPIVEEAKARWIASGLTDEQAEALAAVKLQIADLDGATLGVTTPALNPVEGGYTITIDPTAAGYGWFLDVTPHDNAEFHFVKGLAAWIADGHSPAFSRMDLLTVVMHEMGHVVGFDHSDSATTLPRERHLQHLMDLKLDTGTRFSPILSHVEGPHEVERPLLSAQSETKKPGLMDSVTPLFPRIQPVLSRAGGPVVLDSDDEVTGHEKTLKAKGSWLSRFVSRFTDLEDEDHPNRKIEVVLPGRK